MGLVDRIKGIFKRSSGQMVTELREVGNHRSVFSTGSDEIYANEVARACIRTLAEHTSKANVRILRDDKPANTKLERLIQYSPNFYMNGKDFLYKIRTLLEIHNQVFIKISRDDRLQCTELLPLNPHRLEAIVDRNQLWIKFTYIDGSYVHISWYDLAVLRKDYNKSNVWADDNNAIRTSLDLLATTSEGMANAIKSTSNLRGILKSTKAMLSEDDVKLMKDRFVSDYASVENTSGIASLDATMDFIPIELRPQLANYKNIEELRNNIYRYFGVNEDAIMSRLSGEKWEAFYEARIEPVLLALGLELTTKIFSDRELGFSNEIMFESNRLQYATMTDKLALVQMVDRRAMTPNEWRAIMNMAPVPWGDEPQSWQNPKGGNDDGS